MQNEIMVSVCCITYNHAKYISEAIDSFLMQETDFPFEIILHDDASTDGTTDLILQYKKKHPETIRPIIQKENQWSKGKRITPIAIKEARGKYIALCEGDDYWVDPKKLQKQVDFLEKNIDFSMVFTNRYTIDNFGVSRENTYESKVYSIRDMVKGFIPPTQTLLFRNFENIGLFLNFHDKYLAGDRLISYYCSLHGKVGIIEDLTASYRETGQGVWTSVKGIDKLMTSYTRLRQFHQLLGIPDNNEVLAKKSFEVFVVFLFYGIKRPMFLVSNFVRFYTMSVRGFQYMNKLKLVFFGLKRKLKGIGK